MGARDFRRSPFRSHAELAPFEAHSLYSATSVRSSPLRHPAYRSCPAPLHRELLQQVMGFRPWSSKACCASLQNLSK